MNNALAVRTPVADQLAQAEWFARSGFMPKHLDTPAKVYAVVSLGQELGLGPWAAINNVYLAGGKPTINANLMLALIQGSGALERFDAQVTDTEATVTMARRGVGSYTARFSLDDAERAGLLAGYNGQTWKKYPRAMLKARAIADAARTMFADVLLGMYTPDELGAQVTVDAATGEITVVAEPPAPRSPARMTKDEARKLATKWAESDALTGTDIRAALGGGWEQWNGDYAAADSRVADWVIERHSGEDEPADAHLEAEYENAASGENS
jgi:hypothetical protein